MNPLVRHIRIGKIGVASSSKQGVERFGVVITKGLFVMAGMGRVSVNAVVQNMNINVQKGGAEKGRRAKDLEAEKALYDFQKKESHEIHDRLDHQIEPARQIHQVFVVEGYVWIQNVEREMRGHNVGKSMPSVTPEKQKNGLRKGRWQRKGGERQKSGDGCPEKQDRPIGGEELVPPNRRRIPGTIVVHSL